ncbi:hypothetical protein EJ110_NYTH50372 [Nymphaea thermarum]|nr:hypothetical protein EJ110_NYTH50372 [Nymphaea thermarum]
MAASSSSTVNSDQTEIGANRTENVLVQVTTICLTKENYLKWSAAITMGIAGRGCIAYVNGSKVEPAANRLNDEFENIRSKIFNSEESFSIEDVYSRVEAEEQRRPVTTGGKRDHISNTERSSLVSCGLGGAPKPLHKCTHCKKNGHTVDFCWDLHPKKRDNMGRSSGWKMPVSEDTKSSGGKASISAEQIRELRAYLGPAQPADLLLPADLAHRSTSPSCLLQRPCGPPTSSCRRPPPARRPPSCRPPYSSFYFSLLQRPCGVSPSQSPKPSSFTRCNTGRETGRGKGGKRELGRGRGRETGRGKERRGCRREIGVAAASLAESVGIFRRCAPDSVRSGLFSHCPSDHSPFWSRTPSSSEEGGYGVRLLKDLTDLAQDGEEQGCIGGRWYLRWGLITPSCSSGCFFCTAAYTVVSRKHFVCHKPFGWEERNMASGRKRTGRGDSGEGGRGGSGEGEGHGPTGPPPGRPLRPGPGTVPLSGRTVGPGPGRDFPGPAHTGPGQPNAQPYPIRVATALMTAINKTEKRREDCLQFFLYWHERLGHLPLGF